MQVAIAFTNPTDACEATVTLRPYTHHPERDARRFRARRCVGGWLVFPEGEPPVIYGTADEMVAALARRAFPFGY